jgi:hypothetical protein
MGHSLPAPSTWRWQMKLNGLMQTVADYYEMSFLALRAVLGTSMERYSHFKAKNKHKKYYNNRRSIYCFNNVIIVVHDGLFIYVKAGFCWQLPRCAVSSIN